MTYVESTVHVFHFNYLVDNGRHVAVTQRASKRTAWQCQPILFCVQAVL